MAFEFELPDVGEGIHEGEIVNWLVDEGDTVAEDEDIVEVMTDKATVQISSPVAGTIEDLRFDEGDVVEVGEIFAVIDPAEGVEPADPEAGSDVPEDEPSPEGTGEPEPAEPDTDAEPEPTPAPTGADGTNGHQPQRTPEGILAPPSVRIEARKRGVDIAQVDGSGPAGRVTMADLEAHEPRTAQAEPDRPAARTAGGVSSLLPFDIDLPSVDREDAREVEPVRARDSSPRAHAARAMRLQPHFTHAVEVRADEFVADVDRARDGDESLDLETAFVVKAIAVALRDHERCNAWVDEDSRDLVIADRVNVGVATPTEDGLELRTVADADDLGVREIARRLAEGGDDVEATFTLTSFDGDGGLVSTPVLVHPQVAGAAVGEVRDVGVIGEGQIQAGKELSLAFTFDHRYVDGYGGALLAEDVEDLLSSPGSMLVG